MIGVWFDVERSLNLKVWVEFFLEKSLVMS